MVPQYRGVAFAFQNRLLEPYKSSFRNGEGYAVIHTERGEIDFHISGSAATLSIGFNYVMVPQ
jgi:hypothetical protein